MNFIRKRRILLSGNIFLAGGILSTFIVDPYLLLQRNHSIRQTDYSYHALPKFAPLNPFTLYEPIILGRQLFGYGMQPEAAIKQSTVLDEYQFLGRTRRADENRAFLRHTLTNEIRTVGVSDRIDRIDRIESQSLFVSQGEEQHELKR